MIELLDKLAAIVKDLPELAVWILIGILIYKITIVGSIFGIIRLGIIKLHDFGTQPKQIKYGKYFLSEEHEKDLKSFLNNLKGRGKGAFSGMWIDHRDINFLKQAVDLKIKEDSKEKGRQQ